MKDGCKGLAMLALHMETLVDACNICKHKRHGFSRIGLGAKRKDRIATGPDNRDSWRVRSHLQMMLNRSNGCGFPFPPSDTPR